MKKIIVNSIIFILYITIFILSFFLLNQGGDTLKVNANGKEYLFSLDKDGTFPVEGILGTTIFEIKDNKCKIIASPCPNKTCITAGYSSTLICLPNKVIGTIEKNSSEEDLDVVAR